MTVRRPGAAGHGAQPLLARLKRWLSGGERFVDPVLPRPDRLRVVAAPGEPLRPSRLVAEMG